MFKAFMRGALFAVVLLPSMAAGEPINLKLSFYTSDRSIIYLAAIKPFVDAVNREGVGLLHIDVFLSGTLGKTLKELPQLVLNGDADMAFIAPAQTPERFPDNAAIELPGLFRDAREATMVYTRQVAAGALGGYGDFFVIGAYGTDPASIHSRKPLAALADLRGQKIRTNNLTESAGLEKLGALPIVLPFNETSSAIGSGMIDGSTAQLAALFDIGIGRQTTSHFLLSTSTASLTLVMNRKVFDRLPENAKALILKYSGEWTAAHFIGAIEAANKTVLQQLKEDSRRNVVFPSGADLKTAQAAFTSTRNDWTAASPHNSELFARVNAELSKLLAEK